MQANVQNFLKNSLIVLNKLHTEDCQMKPSTESSTRYLCGLEFRYFSMHISKTYKWILSPQGSEV